MSLFIINMLCSSDALSVCVRACVCVCCTKIDERLLSPSLKRNN